jgi:hypothetical protein
MAFLSELKNALEDALAEARNLPESPLRSKLERLKTVFELWSTTNTFQMPVKDSLEIDSFKHIPPIRLKDGEPTVGAIYGNFDNDI